MLLTTGLNDTVLILSITPNQTIIRGEVIAYQCLFGGNYTIYWEISLFNKVLRVYDNSDEMGYVVSKLSPDCHDNHYTCCQFVSNLLINTSVIADTRTADITCHAHSHEKYSISSPTSLSEFICYLH